MSWSTQHPEVAVPTYYLDTMSSVYRVAVSLGLILTNPGKYSFGNGKAMVQWVHMLSCALSFTKSSFLALNDLSPREWMALDNRHNCSYRDDAYNTIFRNLYSGIIVRHGLEDLLLTTPDGDPDITVEYWIKSPYDNPDWMTFSPVPFHCTWQWIKKLGLKGGTMPGKAEHFTYRGNYY